MLSNEQVISAVLNTRTRGEAARTLGISERALYERLQKPECAEMLREASGKMLEDATNAATGRLMAAVAVIDEIMSKDTADDGTRLRAAESLIRASARLMELSAAQKEWESEHWFI